MDPDEQAADHALSVLKEAEEIKDSDDDFLELVAEKIASEKAIIDRNDALLENISPEEVDEISRGEEKGSLRTDSRNVDDFFARLRKSIREEDHKTEESPEARRRRIKRGRLGNRVMG